VGATAAATALLGQGQTIDIVDAYHCTTALADLNAFNAKFGLPLCVAAPILANAALSLAAPRRSGCTFSVVSSTPAGGMTAAVPAYNASWAPESALDVQWAHATAPWPSRVPSSCQVWECHSHRTGYCNSGDFAQ